MEKLWIKKAVAVFLSVVICGVPITIFADNGNRQVVVPPEEKISKDLYQMFYHLQENGTDLSKEKIPVWIWYQDIDQKQIDNVVTEQTGLTRDNIALKFEMPNPTLLNSLKNEELGSQQQIQSYLSRTKVLRKQEAERTDEFIKTRRAISRQKYNSTSENIINNSVMESSDVLFKSQYAPVVIANISKKQIEELSRNSLIESISLYNADEKIVCSSNSMKEGTTGLNKAYTTTGLTGQGVKVGMFEVGIPELDPEFSYIRVGDVPYDGHATNSAKAIMGSENGVASKITLFATNANFTNIETMISLGVNIINVSFGWITTNPYSTEDKWFDHLTKYHNLLCVCSAGNYTNLRVLSPAKAFNVLTISGYSDMETGNYLSDDIMKEYSYLNDDGCKKPDLIAPANVLLGGTSTSAPIVTGIAALLLELKPSLAYQPQTLKAILMASCQRKVKSLTGVPAETMEQGLTERQGAGAIDAWNAVCIVAQGNYGYGEVSSAAEIRNFVQPSYGASHMNVSIAWLRENTISSSDHAGGPVTSGIQHNLNLYVYRNGVQVGSSSNTNSSTEMAYFPLSASESRYQIKVSNYNHASTETVRYGYAYSTDNMAFRENLTGTDYPEGIYYIRGKSNASGAYLTVDEETGQISQKAFTGEANQQWVSSKTGYEPFTLQTNSSACPGYLSISGQTSAWVRQDSAQYITYGGNGFDNTYGIQLYGLPASNSRSLTALNTSAQSSAAVWQNIGIPERFQWYFEPAGYIRGDVNRDGTVSNADVRLAQNYMNKLVKLDAAQKFLGDMNNDGQVNINDVNLIQQAVSAG